MEHSADYCKNCDQHLLLDQKYCHSCGQKTDTHRINFHFLMHEIQHSIFHVDGGIFYTLKELFTRPGFMLRGYLDGKRIRHFKPVLLLIIIGTVSSLVSYLLNNQEKENDQDLVIFDKKELGTVDVSGLNHYLKTVSAWFTEHIAFSILLLIPAVALGFYLGFKKYKINYPEWLVSITYLASFVMCANFLFMLVESIFHYDVSYLVFFIIFGFVLWTMLQFFRGKRVKSIILRTVWSEFLAFVFVVTFIAIVAVAVLLTGFFSYGGIDIFK